MVNVNKNIVPGKKAESSAKTEPQAPARRPRNQELNSSKKSIPTAKWSLNSSTLNSSSAPEILRTNFTPTSAQEATGADAYDVIQLTDAFKEQVPTADNSEITVWVPNTDVAKNLLAGFDNIGYQAILEHNGDFYICTSAEGIAQISDSDLELMADYAGNLDSSAEGTSEGDSDQSLNSDEGDGDEGDEGFADEPAGDADGGESVGEGADLADVKITTESGNEVSMQDIKIVQNPDTNELAIFIPEDEEETIPEGFAVIGMVVPDAIGSVPAIEGGDVCPECGQDPCVCEGDEDGELDSSKKKSELNCSSSSGLRELAAEYYEDEHDALIDILQSVDDLGYGDSVYEQLIKDYGYEGTDAQQADEALIKMASEDADEHDFLVSLIQAIEDLGYGKQVYTDVLGIGGDIDSSLNCAISEVTVPEQFARTKSKVFDLKNIIEGELANQGFDVTVHQVARPNATTIRVGFDGPDDQVVGIDGLIEDIVAQLTQDDLFNMDSSVNCSMGGGDDRQDATSQVTVPKSFPDDKVHDLYRWVETELWNEGIDIDVYGVGRPSAGVISFEYEVVGKSPAEVDEIIEDRVQEFVQNGYQGLQYPEGDPRHGLNSEKHEKSLNCKVENARVEPTEQGTWVVRADTDRFGKDAILYEHYSEEGANKYLDKLKKGGDLVANGGESHIDLDSSEGTEEAKLDKASIEKAMLKVLKEDKDTPLVFINLDNGVKAYIQPAGYEDNALVADGKFDEAKIYVAMYDGNYKPILVDGKMDKKMPGAEVVDHIKRMLGA